MPYEPERLTVRSVEGADRALPVDAAQMRPSSGTLGLDRAHRAEAGWGADVPTMLVEDSLRELSILDACGEPADVRLLLRRLGVSRSRITSVLARLAELGLVHTTNEGSVRLTAEGRAHGTRVLRRHRLLETFLHDVLGLGLEEVHEEADALEHALSPRLEDKLDAVLLCPSHDPHGHPIPPDHGIHRELDGSHLSLADVSPGRRVRVERVPGRDPAALRWLASCGLLPGGLARVERRETDGRVWVRSAVGVEEPLSKELATSVQVAVVGTEGADE